MTVSGKQTIIDGKKNQPQPHQNRNPHQYAPSAIRSSVCGNQPSKFQRTSRKVKMHEFDSNDFEEFYKVYSVYQTTQASQNEDVEDTNIQANTTQQSTLSQTDSNNEQDLFAVLQAEQKNNYSQQGASGNTTAPPGDIKRLLSSSTRKIHPFF